MTFKEVYAKYLTASVKADAASSHLNTFPRLSNGLTPDAVKGSVAYRQAKRDYVIASGTAKTLAHALNKADKVAMRAAGKKERARPLSDKEQEALERVGL